MSARPATPPPAPMPAPKRGKPLNPTVLPSLTTDGEAKYKENVIAEPRLWNEDARSYKKWVAISFDREKDMKRFFDRINFHPFLMLCPKYKLGKSVIIPETAWTDRASNLMAEEQIDGFDLCEVKHKALVSPEFKRLIKKYEWYKFRNLKGRSTTHSTIFIPIAHLREIANRAAEK